MALRNVVAQAPQQDPVSRLRSATHDVNFLQIDSSVSAVRERPVQRNSEALGLGAEGEGFVVEVDFQLTPSFLVVEMEDRRHRFRGAELQLPCLEVST